MTTLFGASRALFAGHYLSSRSLPRKTSVDPNLYAVPGPSRRGGVRARKIAPKIVSLIASLTASLTAAVTLLGAFGVAAQAQYSLAPTWNQQSPATSPPARYIHGMAYDSGHSQVVLFGGYGNGYLNDTWLYNGTTWTQASPVNSPSPRAAVEMAYDAAHGQVVLFGGLTSVSGRAGDTWLWDGTNWTQASPVNSPPARASASMVYYPGYGVLLFGGVSAAGEDLNDTWLWNGKNWAQQTPASNPSARADYGMAYAAALGEVILFGGDDSGGNYLNDTWIWNGTTWTQANPASNPPARYTPGMDYDAALGQVVMFSGYNGSFLDDTWSFNGTNWTQDTVTTSPSGRYIPNGMVYDAAQSEMVLFGGLGSVQTNDTWTFAPSGNFGNVNVCPAGQTTPAPCSKTLSFTVNVTTFQDLGTPQVLTQGASGLDFTLSSGSTCSGVGSPGTCVVNATFTPLAPGLRTGAVELLYPGQTGIALSIPVYGVGQGPAAAIGPGTQSTVTTPTLSRPKGVLVDAAGNLFVSDTTLQEVFKIAPGGATTTVGTGLEFPQGIAEDGAGNLYIADNNLNEVVEVPAGCTTSSCQVVLGSNYRSQLGVAVDGAGDVFFDDFLDGEVVEIPAGCTAAACQNVVYSPESGSNPVGITTDASGDLFVADFGLQTVTEVPAGCTSANCQVNIGSGWSQPDGVAVDAAGDVFVADAGLDQIVEIPAGCTSYSCQIILAAGVNAVAVSVDAAGDVFYEDLDNHVVLEINRSQTETLNFPTTTLGTTSTASVTLQNIGNQTLQAKSPGLITVSGSSYSNVAGPGVPPDCSATSSLAPAAECNVSILFSPQSYTQPNTGTAAFADNSLNSADVVQAVSLFGFGAKPVQNFYQVNVTEPGSGSGTVIDVSDAINCTETNGTASGTCSASLPGSGTVTFIATASGTSTFVGWGGACAGAGTNSSCSLVLTQAAAITATFANPLTLTVTTLGTGTGTVNDNLGEIACSGANGTTLGLCSGPYPTGTQVTLTASATNNAVFAGWGGACASSGASASCVVTITSALNVSASFVAPGTSQAGTLKPITAGVVYGQGGSFTSNAAGNNGGTLAGPNGVAVDGGGNLYVADGGNNRVLFYPAGSTTPTRVYGQGGSFTSNNANNGGVSANSLNNPEGIALDSSGNLYVADAYNNRVLFYPAGSTTATRVYGQAGSFTSAAVNNGGVSANSLQTPAGVAVDSGGNLYIADQYDNRVLFYPAGSTTATRVYGQGGSFSSYGGNNGGVNANTLSGPAAVAVDSSGDLYVADQFNNRVLFYPANSTTAAQVYGQGGSFTSATPNDVGITPTSLIDPAALAVDASGDLYVVDGNSRVLFYPFAGTTATRVYGQSGSFATNGYNNGGVSANSLAQPAAVALDNSGNVYIADNGNNRVLEFGSFGSVNACPAGQSTPAPCSNTVTFSYAPATSTLIGATQVVTQGATGLDFTLGGGNTCTGGIGADTSCTVNVNFTPLAPGLRTGAVKLFDNNGNAVASTQIYGIGQGPAVAFGPGTQTTLLANLSSGASGVKVDAAGDVFVAGGGGTVTKLTPSGVQSTIPVNGVGSVGIYDLALDGAGDIYVADTSNNRVVEITPGGVQTTVPTTGLATPTGVAVDGPGNLFITDITNNRVLKITPSGVQTTVPTSGVIHPYYPAVDAAGDVFILDTGNERVVEITPGGVQSTVPISGLIAGNGVAVDAAGDVFVTDQIANLVLEVTPLGVQTTVPTSGLNIPAGLTVDAAGDVFIADNALASLVEVNRSQTPSLSFATTNVGSTSSLAAITVQNIGNQPLTGSLALNLGGNFTQNATPDCSAAFPLASSAICGDSFSFTPQSATFFSGTAVFADNNLNGAAAAQTINLSGTGATNGVAGLATVPNVVGQAQIVASAPIASAGLAVGTVSTASSETVLPGVIISQNPASGTQVAVGSAVNLLVSTGLPQPPGPDPLSFENNYFITGDYVSAGVTLRGTGVKGTATGSITIPNYTQSTTGGVPDGADIIDAFLYWETLENTPTASSSNGTFNNYSIAGQQIGNDIPNYVDGQFTGTIRAYRADVNLYLPVSANGIRYASGTYTVGLPDSGGTGFPLTEGASLVIIYRVLSPNFPLKSVVIYDGSVLPTSAQVQVMQGFYDAVGGANGTGKSTSLFASGGVWNNSVNTSVTLGQSNQYSAPLNSGNPYAAVILSTPVNNSDNDGILDAWKTGPPSGDFHAGQPGYYDVKTATWVGLPGAQHGEKDLFVQLDYMCGAVLASGSCDPTQENLFPSPDADGNDPLAMVQQAFANSGVVLHLQVGNAVPEDTCVDAPGELCQFPNEPGVIGWKNSLEFSKLYPRNLVSCLTGGDCTTRFPYGQKDSYHYVLMGHSLAIPAYNTRYGTLTSISVVNGVTTIGTVDRGTGISACPSRITISGVLGDPALNGVYNTTGCADTKTISLATPGVPNYTYPNNTLPEPVIGITDGTVTSISGYSDLGGADSAVTLGLWLTYPGQDMSKRANVLAGTIFHEIGHTLGLSHGGLYYDTPNSYVPTFDANCKPNYQSVMNYLFQLDLVGPNQSVSYSNQALATFSESTAGSVTQLTDGLGNAATFPTSAWYVPNAPSATASAATLHCDGTPLNGEVGYRVDSSIAPINPAWSNGQDLNFIGTLVTNERGYNDIANLDLRQVGATGGEFASLASVLSFGSSVTPLNISAGGNVTLGSGGTVTLGSGGNVTLGSGGNVTLGSGGNIALGSGGSVTLGSGGNVTLGSGATITPGSSGTVTLGSGGNVTLGSGGTITLGSGGNVTLGSGGNVTLGSGGIIALGSGGTVTIPSTGGSYAIDSNGGTITLGSGGNVTLGSGGNVTLGSGGTITLGSGGNVTLGSGGNVTLGSGGTITLGSGGNVTLGSGGNVTLGSGGTITLGSGGTITLGSGGNVTLGSGGTVTLGSGGNVTLGSGGNVTLGSGGEATLGAGGTITLGSGGNVTLGSGGNVTLGSGGTITLGSGGNITLGSGGNVTLGSGSTVGFASGGNITLGSGGTVTFGSSGGTITLASGGAPIPIGPNGSYTFTGGGGTITLGSGGNVTLGSGGNVTLGSGGNVTLGSGGNITLGSGGNVTLGSGGTITLGSGGTITLGSGGNVTLGSGGVVTLGGGSVTLGSGSDPSLGSVSNITTGSGGPASTELTYETANSIVRPPSSPTETSTPAGVRITWKAPAFGVVQTYTVLRGTNGAAPTVIGSVSGVNGNPPATEFTDTNPVTIPNAVVVYTIVTTLVPDTAGPSRSSVPSPPAVVKSDQSIVLGALPSSVTINNPPTVTATAMTSGAPNGVQVIFSASGSCAISSQSIANNVSSAAVTLNSAGSCTITASQPGTTAYNAANSVSGTFIVLPRGSTTKAQTINFATLPNVQYGNSFSLSATSSAGLPVSFTAAGPCTTSGSISAVGVCSVTASAQGNSNYSAASLTQSFNIYPAVLKVTATSLTGVYGQALPALTYSYSGFVNGDQPSVVNGAPALSTTATSSSNAGSYPITVSTGTLATTNYSFLYVSGTLTIQPASQSALTLMTTSPLTYNQSEALSVSGGTTGGTVTYNLISGACTIAGAQLTANSGTGTCQVTATMAGNSNYNPVTSAPANIVALAKASQAIAFTTSPPASAAYNSSFTVAATAGSGSSVAFTSAGACSNSGATYKMTSGTGTCSVIANQAGNSNYAAAVQVTKTVTATLAVPTITFTGLPATATYGAAPIRFSAVSSSGAVPTYRVTGPATLSGTTLTITGAGSISVTASVAAAGNYSAGSATQNVVVAKASLTVKAANLSRNYDVANPALTYAVTGFVNGDTIVVVSGKATLTTTAVLTTPPGTYPITFATETLTATNYSFVYTPGTLTISATLVISPASGNFGSVTVGQTSPAISFTVTNDTPSTMGYLGFTNLGEFYLQPGTCHLVNGEPMLNPGQSCVFTAVFKPTVGGPVSGSLSIQTTSGTFTVPMTGTGATLVISPAAGNFGNVTVGQTSPAISFTATNYTTSTMGYLGFTNLGEFYLQPGTCHLVNGQPMLNTGQSCVFTAVFKPTKAGPVSGNLSIQTTSGTFIVPMTGTGTTP